ncbi:NADP-dependent malic enzyme [Burkholderiaceae bacterium FT117]|uniref:NAD(P)-dependent malic enzyme n=1 Tax=Zeimonas sediminis TaxID=2944268 RepID=UPI002342EBBB|nr:NADP-dependent malic enzyme [Zeimonas sediminis]MCM5569273.1 NADP-dependent malic enzyme [Zeimonas sediminis]
MSPDNEDRPKAESPGERALRLHPFYGGKIQQLPKVPIGGAADFSVWYSPGVAEPCRAIQRDPEQVWAHTNRGNTIAVVSDGSRVLGLGNIGPEAGLPVMEGKALLFKYLGGVDAVALCLRPRDDDEFVRAVRMLEPSFGAINLEDIAQPRCFRILDALRGSMDIPVWHDDQQGTAVVVLAGLLNALEVVGKRLDQVRIAMVGIGAANNASYRLLKAVGVDPGRIVACDTGGTLHRGRADIAARPVELAKKWGICLESNAEGVQGGIAEALRGADVCLAFSTPGPGTIAPEWVRGMARDAIVFACANPVPEIWPDAAREAGARVVATGRGDFPNQVNNSLCFPAIFRGVLDVRARTISDAMAIAAARELAAFARERGISETDIVPKMSEWAVYPRVAAATGMAAQGEGVARLSATRDALIDHATRVIGDARRATEALMREGIIAAPPK